ncbi:MAG: sulfite exporter TauE/SafE family protein [Mailhella sp.]|nr:sulfite exporter TauE/SafE family protein [Mailhella sp.]
MMTLACVFLGWVFGGFLSGVSAFGAMMGALPILSLVMPPLSAVLTCCLVAVPCCVQLAWLYRRHVDWNAVKWLALSCIPGSVLGTATLAVIPVSVLQVGISLLIAVFIVVQLIGHRMGRRMNDSVPALCVTGAACGFTSAAISIIGVPLGIYILLASWDKDRSRGTMGMFFCLGCCVTVLSQWAYGLYGPELVPLFLSGTAGVFLGQYAGFLVGRHINQAIFVKFVLAFLSCASVMLFCRGVGI